MTILGKHLKVWMMRILAVLAFLLTTMFVSSQDHANAISTLDWNSDASRLAIARYDKTLEIIDASTNVQLISYGPLDLGISSISWSPADPNKIAVAGGLGIVTILDLSTNPPTAIFTEAVNTVDAIAWSSDGTKLVGAVEESSPPNQLMIHEWNPVTGALVDKFQIYDQILNRIIFSPDNTLVAGGSVDGNVVIWDANTHTQTALLNASYRFEDGYSFVDALSWSPDSQQLVTANHYGSPTQSNLGFWDAESGELLANYLRGFIRNVEWSPTGNQVAFTEGNNVQIMEALTGNLISTFESSASINGLSWSSDGTTLTYGGRDGIVSLAEIPQLAKSTATPTATLTENVRRL